MDFLTNPFTTALLFLYQFLGQNIVLTIIVFTVLIRLATYPLTYQQIKSSKAFSVKISFTGSMSFRSISPL